MSQFEVKKISIDTEKVYKPEDKLVFNLVVNNKSEIKDCVEFTTTYLCDSYFDQQIGNNVVGPLQEGSLSFDLETSPIDLTKIPIKKLFGLTAILISGKFNGKEFVRIGYVVNVTYPGVETATTQDSDETPLNEEEMEEGIEEDMEDDGEEDIEEEDGLEEEIEEEDGLEDIDEEELNEDEELSDETLEIIEDEELDECEDENCKEYDDLLEESLANAFLNTNAKNEPIPLETTIVNDKDEFEFKGQTLLKSKIQMSLMKEPIIHVYDISWSGNEAVEDENEIQESSSKEDDINTTQNAKKIKN